MGDMMPRIQSQLETLPERLGGHIFLTLTALLIGVLVSVPMGILAIRRPWLERASLFLASIVQTIPGLALLALMVFIWGQIGWLPALIALTLYSVLPVLRNTITGLQGLDPAILEAARGVGMSDLQTLGYVQLPLAMPTIVAGIRTAAVWVVGAATIAQPVGATSLGNYIFVGLQTFNFTAIMFGCVLSALLALILDGLLHGLEIAVAQRSRLRAAAMASGLLLLALVPFLLSLFSFGDSRIQPHRIATNLGQRKAVRYVVGSKAFTEQYIWSQIIKTRLANQGVETELKDGMGSAFVFNALVNGQVDCYVDYTGTVWTNYMKQKEVVAPVEMLVDVTAYLKQENQIYCLGPLGFSNDYAFAMPKALARQHGISTLADLARVSQDLVGGTDIEFFDRPEWEAVRATYQLDFKRKTTMDPTLMYGAVDSGQLDVIVAFNTDSRIARYDLTVLEDPAYALPPYDAVLLVSARMARDPQAMKALRPLVQSVNSVQMRKANGMVDVDGQTVAEASRFLLDGM